MKRVCFPVFVVSLLFHLFSCSSSGQEVEKLRAENEELKKELSELKSFRDSLEVIPYIDNTTFKTTIGEPYYLQLLSIIPNDIEIESVEINGDKVNLNRNKDLLTYNEYGPRLKFAADSVGVYEFKLNAKFDIYDGKIVPLSFPIEVTVQWLSSRIVFHRSKKEFQNSKNIINIDGFFGTVDFDPGPGQYLLQASTSVEGTFVQKLDTNGDFLWVIAITSSDHILNYDLDIGVDGSIYAAGIFYYYVVVQESGTE